MPRLNPFIFKKEFLVRSSTQYRSAVALATLAGSCAVAFAQQGPCPTDCNPQRRITICYEAGRIDNFNAIVDPTTIRPYFNALLATIPPVKPFDSPAVNARFGHTFGKLPCGIVGATLEVKLRAENDIPQNDSINLQWQGAGWGWGSVISALPGSGGTWNPGQTNTVVLNLAALPGGGSLLPFMNITNALDVYLQDDTSIDYAKLTLIVCPCDGPYRVYTSGSFDNFASPTDPTFRQPRLTALRTIVPFTWRDSDSCTLDRGWGHTFTSLPGGIVRGSVGIRMKPCGGGSGNDSINFELLNPGHTDSFARGYTINLLPGAGAWSGNPLTNFNFNLNNELPSQVCGTNLLGGLLDRMFDIYVQDDTGVDAARLIVQPCPPLRHAFGTPIFASGTARVDSDSSLGRQLRVTVAPSDQPSGVRFDAHGTVGQTVEFVPDEFLANPPGTVHRFALEADLDGDGSSEGEEVFGMKWINNGPVGGTRLEPLEPLANPPEWLINWVLYNSQTNQSLRGFGTSGFGIEVDRAAVSSLGWSTSGTPSEPTLVFTWKCGAVASCRTPDGQVFMADVVSFEQAGSADIETLDWSFGATQHGPMLAHTVTGVETAVSGCCSNVGTVRGQLPKLKLNLSAIGNLNTNRDGFTLSNLGGGLGGITIDCDRADEISMRVTPVCAGTVEECANAAVTMDVSYVGSIGGQSGRPAGSSTCSRLSPNQTLIHADISDVASGSYIVMFGDRDNNYFSKAVDTGVVDIMAIGSAKVSGCGKQAVVIGGVRTACLWWDFEFPVTFQFQGSVVEATRVRVVAGSPAESFDYLESTALRVSGVSDLDVTELTIVPVGGAVTCFADFDQSGGVDGSDVDAFFAAWVNGDAAADVDQSGGIDGADVDLFFIQWSNGGC